MGNGEKEKKWEFGRDFLKNRTRFLFRVNKAQPNCEEMKSIAW